MTESQDLPKIGKIWYPATDGKSSKSSDESTDPFNKEASSDSLVNYDHIQKILANQSNTARSKQHTPRSAVSIYNIVDCIEPPYNLDHLAKLYDKSNVHAAAVDAKIDNIVGLGYYFDFNRKSDKLRQKANAKGEESRNKMENKLIDAKETLKQIIGGFNQTDEFDETLEKFLKDRFTTGNGYLEIGRTVNGDIGYVGHIPSSTMRVRRLRDGFVQYVNNEPIFFRNFGDRTTPDPFGMQKEPNEIIHYKAYSPTSTYYGVPEVISTINQIAGIEFATKYNIDYFENKAVPRYIIITKNVTVGAEVQKELLKFFETATKGTHHRSIVVPLPSQNAEIEFKPVETGKQESSFDEYIKLNQSIILMRHRVPANRLGKSDGTSLAASRDSDKIFKEAVCRPEQRKIEQKINKIFKEFTDLFDFKLNEYSLTDEDQQSQIDERYLRWGVMTPDEVRARRGMGPRADGKGDEPVDNKSMQEAQIAAQEKMAKENAKVAANNVAGGGPAAQSRADQKAQANQSRTRDQQRNASNPDSAGSPTGRNTKGSGRKVG